uniref:Solute carrier organic anion transporter family member n=1 Tax=Romanomermis culicivorax TaxID=13658 RepID=A0A915IWA8_ROMCU
MPNQDLTRTFCCFLCLFYVCIVLESIVSTFLGSAIQSLERQFQIPSSKSGLLVSASRLGTVPTVLFLAYFGNKGNKVRWIGFSCLLIAGGCFLAATPNFLFPLKNDMIGLEKSRSLVEELNFNSTNVGNRSQISDFIKNVQQWPFTFCNESASVVRKHYEKMKCQLKDRRSGVTSNDWAFGLVFGAIFLFGVGQSVPWTVGTPLIDDAVKKKHLPYHFATMRTVRILGPLGGLWLAAGCFKLYVNLDAPSGMTPMDPRWIGAWWLGFLVTGFLLIMPSVGLIFFKKRHQFTKNYGTPSEKNLRDNIDSEDLDKLDKYVHMPNGYTDQGERSAFISEMKDFLRAIGKCAKSPVYVSLLLARIFETFSYRGVGVFKAKYIENHYGIPQHQVNFYLGIVSTVSFAGGIIAGSFIMKRYKFSGRQATMYVVICSILTIVVTWLKMLLKCRSINSAVGELAAECDCNMNDVYPVCSSSGQIFSSPCHAGCKNLNSTILGENDPVFIGCDCTIDGFVSRSYCTSDCTVPLILFYLLSVVSGIIVGTAQIPQMMVGLRLAMTIFITTLFSAAPSTVIAGKFIDDACRLWNKVCGRTGTCLLYNPDTLRIRFHLLYIVTKIVSVLFEINVWYWSSSLILTEKKTLRR